MIKTRGVWNDITNINSEVITYLADIEPEGYLIDKEEIDGTTILTRAWSTVEQAQLFIDFIKQFPESLEITIIEE